MSTSPPVARPMAPPVAPPMAPPMAPLLLSRPPLLLLMV